jgi:DNA modification methylase
MDSRKVGEHAPSRSQSIAHRRTRHTAALGDARELDWLDDSSVHLVLTSPPYWTLIRYNDHPGQLGAISAYDDFLDELDRVWKHVYRVLVPGGRLICVVGDVCLSRRRNRGRHEVVPLHGDISVRARRIGFEYLTPIYWHKITNARYEVSNGSAFLGKPFEPNAVIKNDTEYILMLRKPGYRSPTLGQRSKSRLTKEQHRLWFRSTWTDIRGESKALHPAPFPQELAVRLIRMFSFAGDTVLDPFLGTGTTMAAALATGRSSIGIEIDPAYLDIAIDRVASEVGITQTPDRPSGSARTLRWLFGRLLAWRSEPETGLEP